MQNVSVPTSHTLAAGYADPMQTFGDVLAELDVFVRYATCNTKGAFDGTITSFAPVSLPSPCSFAHVSLPSPCSFAHVSANAPIPYVRPTITPKGQCPYMDVICNLIPSM